MRNKERKRKKVKSRYEELFNSRLLLGIREDLRSTPEEREELKKLLKEFRENKI